MMQKYAKGGVAMTINSVPQEERSRSGSQPRYPYNGDQPFIRQQQKQYVDNSRDY